MTVSDCRRLTAVPDASITVCPRAQQPKTADRQRLECILKLLVTLSNCPTPTWRRFGLHCMVEFRNEKSEEPVQLPHGRVTCSLVR